RVFFLYLFVCVAGTIMIAYAFQYLVFTPYVDTGNPVLQGVRSISGGSSAVITKAHNNKFVKVVMNPGGKGIIATYNNSVEGRGGIVFDSGGERFMEGSANKYDNRRYMENIAAWLEENNVSEGGRNILIYNTAGSLEADKDPFSRSAFEGLEKKDGFKIKLTDRKETPQISRSLLEQYSQLWIIFGEAGPACCFSDAELKTITGFSQDGKGLLIAAGKHHEGTDLTAVNRLSSGFGVTFSGPVENAEELRVSTSFYFFNRMSELLERFYKQF
ncbi:MAG: permease, partial [Nitrospirae bacterium]|nr:permease [Nitrospirota bacterium]